jgi:hypothetical protein
VGSSTEPSVDFFFVGVGRAVPWVPGAVGFGLPVGFVVADDEVDVSLVVAGGFGSKTCGTDGADGGGVVAGLGAGSRARSCEDTTIHVTPATSNTRPTVSHRTSFLRLFLPNAGSSSSSTSELSTPDTVDRGIDAGGGCTYCCGCGGV